MKYTITKEEGAIVSLHSFVVRNVNRQFQAAFVYRGDAELFVTMMGCTSCKRDVTDHVRFKRANFQPDRTDCGNN